MTRQLNETVLAPPPRQPLTSPALGPQYGLSAGFSLAHGINVCSYTCYPTTSLAAVFPHQRTQAWSSLHPKADSVMANLAQMADVRYVHLANMSVDILKFRAAKRGCDLKALIMSRVRSRPSQKRPRSSLTIQCWEDTKLTWGGPVGAASPKKNI